MSVDIVAFGPGPRQRRPRGRAVTCRNLGSLYLLPELRQPLFTAFREDRTQLKRCYGRLIRASRAEGDLTYDDDRLATDLLFALGEGVILIRSDRPAGADLDDLVTTLPDAGLAGLDAVDAEVLT